MKRTAIVILGLAAAAAVALFVMARRPEPLRWAIRNDVAPLVTVLAACGADLDARGNDGWVPLQIAVMNGRLRAANSLLRRGADKTVRDRNKDTLIWWAARNDQLSAVQLLLANGVDVKEQDKGEDPLIVFAATHDKLALVKLLLESGADPDDQIVETLSLPAIPPGAGIPDGTMAVALVERTPLLVYAVKKKKLELAKLLLEHKAKPNASDGEGSALYWAADTGSVDLAWLLIAGGAKINEDAKRAYTPLHIASQKGHLGMVKLLVEHEASVNATTPFYLEIDIIDPTFGIVHIGHGGDPQHEKWRKVEDITPLDLAVQERHADVADFLRAHGAKRGKKFMHLD
jgi:ankyrin repeat protein